MPEAHHPNATEHNSTPAGAPVSLLPSVAMDALDAARTALMQYEREIAVRESAARERALHAERRVTHLEESLTSERANTAAELSTLQDSVVNLRSGHADLNRQCGDLKQENAELHDETAHMRAERDALRSESDSLRAQLATQRAEGDSLRAEVRDQRARADSYAKRNEQLRHDLLEMHRDLSTTDSSTLILRTAMSLTNAEQGLFTDESGEHVIADVGMEEIAPAIKEQLLQFVKQALRDESPVIRNDSENLPDTSQCVNLAALPVAVQNEAGGAILVANKRSGPFDEDDTQVLLSVGRHAGIAIQNQRLHFALEDAYRMTIAVLADAIEAKDPYTRGHCESVSRLAVAVAQELGCKGEELDIMRYAALLHDVGKIGVSDGVLLKPSKLLPEEFSLIQRHSAIGADLIKRIPALSKVVPLILHHHEHMDGSGYPDGLDGEGIPLGARIIGAVDAFDAMTTPRPYRNPVSYEEALQELRRCAGTQFDPRVIETLGSVLDETDTNPPERTMEAH